VIDYTNGLKNFKRRFILALNNNAYYKNFKNITQLIIKSSAVRDVVMFNVIMINKSDYSLIQILR